jgi:hypothetical protein
MCEDRHHLQSFYFQDFYRQANCAMKSFCCTTDDVIQAAPNGYYGYFFYTDSGNSYNLCKEENSGGFMTMKELLEEVLGNSSLDESTRVKVGKFAARKDSPHFQGDDYHAHVPDGKYEYSWCQDGSRKHPRKFKEPVPKKAKAAAAQVLNIDVSMLEKIDDADMIVLLGLLEEEIDGIDY